MFTWPERRLVLIFILAAQITAAVEDSVRTFPIIPPDFLARVIVAPILPGATDHLKLIGWSLFPKQAAVEVTISIDSLASTMTFTPGQLNEIHWRAGRMLKIKDRELMAWSDVDTTGRFINFHNDHDGVDLRLPSAQLLENYVHDAIRSKNRAEIRKVLAGRLQTKSKVARGPRRTIEVLGADIGGQRVSLRVQGNVKISGKLNFKDQSKSYTNFRANKNWDLEVNQTQRFDIEGTVGDRVSILVNQDSEREFDWENNMKIAYKGKEDEILQKINAGNISLSLPGTRFATGGGGTSKGLFGIKSESKFGPLKIIAIASIERAKKVTASSTHGQEMVISDLMYLSNRYFFLDMDYRAAYFPLDDLGRHRYNRDRLVLDIELFRVSNTPSADTYQGTAHVDPDNPEYFSTKKINTDFTRLEIERDYTLDPQLGYIRLMYPASPNDILAAAFTIGREVGDTTEVFARIGTADLENADTTALNLKLLKIRGQVATDPTWPLEFKNVYSLGVSSVVKEGFEVKIINRKGDSADEDRARDGTSYIEAFGLDQEDANGVRKPDNRVDVDNLNIVNTLYGELHFPALLPFAYSSIEGLATSHPALKEIYGVELEDKDQDFRFDRVIDGIEIDISLVGDTVAVDLDAYRGDEDLNGDGKFTVPALYYRPNQTTEKNNESSFDILVKQTQTGQSVYSLGFNYVPGSETVRIGNQTLQRGKDYTVDEFSGTVTILEMGNYADPEVIIDYERNDIISFDKKVMLGTRAELDLGGQSFLGFTGLYYDQTIVDERVEVGREPISNMLMDVNGKIGRDLPFLTRLVDRLPGLATDAPSQFNLEGEYARVFPNPNPLGEAYIDDFEASKRITSPSMQYRAWQNSAPPVDRRYSYRRKLAWWNPYTDVNVRQIWPNRSTSVQAQNQTTKVLVLDALFRLPDHDSLRTALSEIPLDSLWGGIIYPLYSSDYDQTNSKFFEIWLKGSTGRLHIDVGTMSEDLNGNDILDTEDLPEGGLALGDGYMDPGEDVGIDGCPDEFEDGMGGCLAGDYNANGAIDEWEEEQADGNGDGLSEEDTEDVALAIIAGQYDGIYDGPRVQWADTDDPNGDNYHFELNSSRNDFINGTEGNAQSMDFNYPDDEDLDGLLSRSPATQNDYLTFSFQLDSTHMDFDHGLVASYTEFDNGDRTGWRLFRVPLGEFVRAGDGTASWDNVKNVRLWIDELGAALEAHDDLTARLQIAKIEFVGNEWEELGLAANSSDLFGADATLPTMAVTVANTEDNAEYEKPPGVRGEYDRINNIELREQSLVLDFSRDGIPAGYKGGVSRAVSAFNKNASFLVYQNMKMYVHGVAESKLISTDSTQVWFWLRLGRVISNDTSYYEVRKPIYKGWDSRNHIDINMEQLATLKLRDDPDTLYYTGTDTIPGFTLKDGMQVLIKGDPSWENISTYSAGVLNMHPDQPVYGKVMLDEFRLTNAQREGGGALRLSSSLKIADVMKANMNYSREDADFHNVQQKLTAKPTNKESWSVGISFFPAKFLPQTWGIRLPIDASFKNSVTSPKFYPSSDIFAGSIREAPDEIQTKSNAMSLKTSFNKSSRSKFWLVRQTIDRVNSSVQYNTKSSSSVNVLSEKAQTINGQLAYKIKFGEESYIQPFAALSKIPVLGPKIEETRVYYLPGNLDFSTAMTERSSDRITRVLPDSVEQDYTLSMTRGVSTSYKLTDRIRTSFNRNESYNLEMYRDSKIAIFQTFDPGIRLAFNEKYSLNYDPDFIRWFRPKFSYNANYNWKRNQPFDEVERGSIGSDGRFSTQLTLTPKELIEIIYTPEKTRSTSRRGRGTARSNSKAKADEEKLLEIKNERIKAVLKVLHGSLSKVSPFNFSYSHSSGAREPAVIGQPSLRYRLALADSSGIQPDSTVTGVSSSNKSWDFSVRSGFNIARSVNVNISHSKRWSYKNSTSSETENITEDFFFMGDPDKLGLPFINWSINWSGLEKLPYLEKLPWRVSMDHNYSGSRTENSLNGTVASETYTQQFQPLVGLTMNFTNGMSSNLRASRTLTLSKKLSGGETRNTTQQISSNFSYQHRGGMKIPLPFLKDLDLQNSVNFNLEFQLNNSHDEQRKGEAAEFSTTTKSSGWGINPYITYTFTDKVTGSVRLGYNEDERTITGKRITRSFGFDLNIAIRGS